MDLQLGSVGGKIVKKTVRKYEICYIEEIHMHLLENWGGWEWGGA